MSTKIKYKKGDIIGQYTIIESPYRTQKTLQSQFETKVRAKCVCGFSFEINIQNLKRKKRCNKCDINPKIKKLEGQKFNKLLVLERIINKKYKSTHFKCLCDCGNYTVVDTTRLTTNKTKSCGCIRKNIPRKRNTIQALRNKVIDSYKRNAQNRKLSFNLTNEEVINFLNQNCYYCGCIPSTIRKYKNRHEVFIYNGIDRIDNTLGYCKENCVTCCKICNNKKRAMFKEDFLSWIEKVYNHSIRNACSKV